MKLYFRNSQNKLRVIAEPTSEKECNATIKQFLDEHGFKRGFAKIWTDYTSGRKIYEVVIHSVQFELDNDEE